MPGFPSQEEYQSVGDEHHGSHDNQVKVPISAGKLEYDAALFLLRVRHGVSLQATLKHEPMPR